MSESALSRHAGPIVLTVGAYVAATHLALLLVVMNFDNQAAMLADPIFRVLNLAYAAAFSGLAIAACAAYHKHAREAGMFGLVAFCAAIVGTVNLVSRFGSVFTSGGAGDDLVGGLGPDEGLAAIVPAVDEDADRGNEVLD